MLRKWDWMHIQVQVAKGMYQKDIAAELGVHPRTVRRALKRGGPPSGKWPKARKSKHRNSRKEHEEKDALWMRRLMQGDISLDELMQDIGERIPLGDVKKLYDCALTRPVRYRNRALSLLSLLKGISRHRIADYLFISRRSVNRSSAVHKTCGAAAIVSDKGKRPLKQEDPGYVECREPWYIPTNRPLGPR